MTDYSSVVAVDVKDIEIGICVENQTSTGRKCRSNSLDAADLTPSQPTPLRRFESDPVTKHEKEEATELHLPKKSSSPSAARLSLKKIMSVPKLLGIATPSAPNPETFFCKICLENCSCSLGFVVCSCANQHKYCRDCLSGYYTAQIADGSIEHFCPGVGEGCKGRLSNDEVQSLVSEETYSKFERFVQVKKNPLYRECPTCNIGVTLLDQTPSITCGSCGLRYCFFHANAHEGLSCEEYVRRQSRRMRVEQAASSNFVRSHTQNCPHCFSPTEKNGGCNHMTCQNCRQHWCWLCGRKIVGDVSEHFRSSNIFGCPGGQYAEASRMNCLCLNPLLHCGGIRLLINIISRFAFLLGALIRMIILAVAFFIGIFPGLIFGVFIYPLATLLCWQKFRAGDAGTCVLAGGLTIMATVAVIFDIPWLLAMSPLILLRCLLSGTISKRLVGDLLSSLSTVVLAYEAMTVLFGDDD